MNEQTTNKRGVAAERRNAISKTIVTAIAACSVILGLLLICLGIYAVRQKRRAERAVELSKPFGMTCLLQLITLYYVYECAITETC